MNHLVKHLRRLNGKQSKPVKYFDITTPYLQEVWGVLISLCSTYLPGKRLLGVVICWELMTRE